MPENQCCQKCEKTESGSDRVRQTESRLYFKDHWGSFLARLGIGRAGYTVAPGLYALNGADADAPVFVSANYKMSFDALRRGLKDIPAWILVLDTKGINVWCAAGKGTFGTDEIIRRVQTVGLARRVKHRRLIVPQLGAPGVASHQVLKACGFKVLYGPVHTRDIVRFMESGMDATAAMRRVTFDVVERAVLIPVEVIGHLKYVFWATLYFMIVSGIGRHAFSFHDSLLGALIAAFFLLAALVAGTVFTPLLLPFIPGSAFSWKGALMGGMVYMLLAPAVQTWMIWDKVAWGLMVVSLASFSAMNFTGASTYTSLSGVMKEMRIALPIQIAGFVIGAVIWTVHQWI